MADIRKLQKLKELEEQRRKQKNANLGLINSTDNNRANKLNGAILATAPISPIAQPTMGDVIPPSPTPGIKMQNSGSTMVSKTSAISSPSSIKTNEVITKKLVAKKKTPSMKGDDEDSDTLSLEEQEDGAIAPGEYDENDKEFPAAKNLAALGIASVYDPEDDKNSTSSRGNLSSQNNLSKKNKELMKSMNLSKEMLDAKEFINRPAEQGQRIQCQIVRRKFGTDKLMCYDLYLELEGKPRLFMISAIKKKKLKAAGSTYLFSSVQYKPGNQEKIIGKLRSNFLGTEFTLYDGGCSPFKEEEKDYPTQEIRQELASVIYESNILGFKGPRKMTVLLPGMKKDGQPIVFKPKTEKETIIEKFKNKKVDQLLELHNKNPQWNEETQSYVLNFRGRVTVASVKNFQLVHDNDIDYVVCQFGRIGDELFTLDLQYPITPLQALGLALSSFDEKKACE